MAAHGGGEAAAKTAWQKAGIRMLPGTYLAREEAGSADDYDRYVRIALVHDADTTEQALGKLAAALAPAG